MINKIAKIIHIFFFTIIGLAALLISISILPISGNIKILTVLSGSMEPAIKTGAVIVVKPSETYNIGDVITFGSTDKKQKSVTHRIADIRTESGKPIYKTKGDANETPDTKEVGHEEVIGKVLIDIPYLGYVIEAAKKPLGFLALVIIPAVAIAIDEIKKIWKEIIKIKNARKNNP